MDTFEELQAEFQNITGEYQKLIEFNDKINSFLEKVMKQEQEGEITFEQACEMIDSIRPLIEQAKTSHNEIKNTAEEWRVKSK